jgi:hydroxymethylpyrimidine pyrophosphatase-like HAD family hydrolase
MSVFQAKLNSIPATIALADNGPIKNVAQALRGSKGKIAVAIGSGGSTVVAEYFSRCRETLGLGLTIVKTPMEFVLSNNDWDGYEIWLFSAGADNPDVAAAFSTAVKSAASTIRLMTVRQNGATTASATGERRTDVFVLPVAEPKDGFIATHSMMAMVVALLYASDALCELPSGQMLRRNLLEAVVEAVRTRHPKSAVTHFRQNDTVLVLHDPQARPLVALIETSLWETGVAQIQETDFRNFAHGRHVWAAKYPERMFVLALTGAETRGVWSPIAAALPPSIRIGRLDLGHAGRLRLAVAMVEGLLFIEAMGSVMGIDPGKPGRGAFAEPIYESPALVEVAASLTPAVRHKIKAIQEHDEIICTDSSASASGKRHLNQLGNAEFKGLALDYDGTTVPTDDRLSRPNQQIVAHLIRLIKGGIQVAFATGRGGSVGEMLREVFPAQIQPLIIMGYYNGGHIRTLDVDIRHDPPPEDAALRQVAEWVENNGLLKPGVKLKRGNIQIMLNHSDVVDSTTFQHRMMSCPELVAEEVRLVSSHHSFDFLAKGSNKRLVLDEIRRQSGDAMVAILCVGDSGSPCGNDRDLLSEGTGISVDSVCGMVNGCWSLFGVETTGPAALLLVLEALELKIEAATLDLSKLLDVS